MVDFVTLGIDDGEQREFVPTWDEQRAYHARVAAGELPATVLFVEHTPVYTAGRRTEPQERPFDGTPVVDVDRGGKITWHGPGQLVGYPIVRLAQGVGVVDYVRRVEQAVIDYIATLGVTGTRVEGRTGVWVVDGRGERKICAIGIRVARRTTLHGFALNLRNDLGGFGNIIPCGITDAGVTSVAAETGSAPTVAEAARAIRPHLAEHLEPLSIAAAERDAREADALAATP